MSEATQFEEVLVPMEPQELARVDALLPLYSTPERRATRAEVLRALVAVGLGIVEEVEGPPTARKRRMS